MEMELLILMLESNRHYSLLTKIDTEFLFINKSDDTALQQHGSTNQMQADT